MILQLFFLLILIPAYFVVTLRNPIYSVLALIAVFFNLAMMLLCLEVEFLALVFLVVYVGAIAVLFLFVVMMLNVSRESYSPATYYYPLMVSIFSVVLSFLGYLLLDFKQLSHLFYDFGFTSEQYRFAFYSDFGSLLGAQTNSQYLAQVLYTYNFVPFFLAAMILLIAMVGSIALTIYHRPETKRQQTYRQVEQSYASSIRLSDFKIGG